MLKQLSLVILLLTVVNNPVFADKQQHILLGHTTHPQLDKYISLLQQAYFDIGYSVRFIPIPGERSLISLKDGLIDGVVFGSSELAGQIDNLLRIEVKIAEGSTYLLCQKDKTCNQSVFSNPKAVILSRIREQLRAEVLLKVPFEAKFVDMERNETLLGLMLHKRSDYALYVVDNRGLPTEILLNLNTTELYNVSGYHYVNTKYKHLKEPLELALKRNLQLMKADF